MMTDESLVESARQGEESAFDELVRRHQEKAYALALRLSGSTSDAEEILQEAFLQAYRGLATFRGDARFTTWLYRIVTNAALMHRRALKRRKAVSLDEYLPQFREDGRLLRLDLDYGRAARADEILERAELARKLKEAMEDLPDDYRTVVELRDLEELSTEETAEILGVAPALVSTRLHRARLMLRAFLGRLTGGEP